MGKRESGALTLSFLLYPCEDDPKRFVAHCLELDVVAVEHTKPKAILLLKELITELFAAALEDGTVDKLFRPAPAEYWQKLVNAKPYRPPERVLNRHILAPPVRRVDYALAQV